MVAAKKETRAVAKRKADNPPEKSPRWELEGMNEAQRMEAEAIQKRVVARPRRATIQMETKKGGRTLTVGDGSEVVNTLHSMRFYEATGSASADFAQDMLTRLSELLRLTGDDRRDSDMMSAAIALIASVDPRNELEATMALQMVAANEAVQMCFNRSRKADRLDQATAFSNLANKAMRSFALHAETLARLRRGGEQVVRHVHVNEGGQAVIAGTVNTGRAGGE